MLDCSRSVHSANVFDENLQTLLDRGSFLGEGKKESKISCIAIFLGRPRVREDCSRGNFDLRAIESIFRVLRKRVSERTQFRSADLLAPRARR